jgi:hypothetical protein
MEERILQNYKKEAQFLGRRDLAAGTFEDIFGDLHQGPPHSGLGLEQILFGLSKIRITWVSIVRALRYLSTNHRPVLGRICDHCIPVV